MSAKKSQQEYAATEPIETSITGSQSHRGLKAYTECVNAQQAAWVDYTKTYASDYAEWVKSVREADSAAWKPVEEARFAYARALVPFFDKESYRRFQEAAENLAKAQSAFNTSEERREAYRAAAERFDAAQKDARAALRARYAEAYRAYLRAIKESWADLDPESIDFDFGLKDTELSRDAAHA